MRVSPTVAAVDATGRFQRPWSFDVVVFEVSAGPDCAILYQEPSALFRRSRGRRCVDDGAVLEDDAIADAAVFQRTTVWEWAKKSSPILAPYR